MSTTLKARTIAASLLAGAASVFGMVAVAAPAQAADQFYAVALGYINENPPVTMAGGSAVAGSAEAAGQQALTNCSNNGGGHCVTMAVATNGCAAAASNRYGEEKAATDASLSVAESKAKALLENQTDVKIIVSGCSNGSTPPPPQPPTPPAPKLGPAVSFQKVVGGLEAHISDRSGVSSQCTYATDNFSRDFPLEAGSRYYLRIVPAVPQFRNWTVTITCDNGTSTTTTTYF
jgi:hypothetical protein